MNNKKCVIGKFFLQEFLQLKKVGIVSILIMLLLTVVNIVNQGITLRQRITLTDGIRNSNGVMVMNSSDFLTAFTLTFICVTPLLVLFSWSFLNKRSTSDFYHSIPIRREWLYGVKMAVICTWQILLFVITGTAMLLAFAIFQDVFVVSVSEFMRMFLAMFLANVLCGAAGSVACAITGNAISNICLSGLIIFLPTYLILVTAMVLQSITIVATKNSIVPGIDAQHNIITGIVFSIFSSNDASDIIFSLSANVYTFVLACVYLVVGCLLFKNRKSETAGKAAPNKYLQFLIRTLIGFVIASVGTVLLLLQIERNQFDTEDILTLIELLLISGIAVFVYEAISGKQQKNFRKSIYSIVTAWILAAIFACGIHIGANNVLHYKPDVNEISSVKFMPQRSFYGMDIPYWESIFTSLEIKDKEIIQIVADSVKDNAEHIQNDDNAYRSFYSDKTEEYVVYIKDNVIGRYRTVFFKKKDFETITKILTQTSDFREKCLDLPAFKDISIYGEGADNAEEIKKIYELLLQESREIPFEDWYGNMYENSGLALRIVFSKNGKSYTQELNITNKLPETYQAYMELLNRNVDETSLQRASAYVQRVLTGTTDKYENCEYSIFISGKDADGTSKTYVTHLDNVRKPYNEAEETFLQAVHAVMQKPAKERELQKDANVKIGVRYVENEYDEQSEQTQNYYVNYYFTSDAYSNFADIPQSFLNSYE